MPHHNGIMTPQTAIQAAEPVRSTDTAGPPLQTLSEWHKDQFDRHLRYARSLGLSPDHASRFALQQLQAAKPRQVAQPTQ